MIRGRQDLPHARRVVIKAGTSVISTPDGYPSLTRMASIVENAAQLVRSGKEVLIVTSGAVGVGRQRLRKQAILRQSMSDLMTQKEPIAHGAPAGIPTASDKVSYICACSAAGQLGLMSLYETMFSQFDITTSQLLVTSFDFTSPERRRNVQYVICQLLALGIVPLLNENDAVSANQGYESFGNTFSDNDSLASLVSIEMSAQLLILLTDVKGVYDRPPTDLNSKLIDVFNCDHTTFKVGEKSMQGRGGMGAKVDAALSAIHGGVHAVIIAAGLDSGVVAAIMAGEKVGTIFVGNPEKRDDSEIVIGSVNEGLVLDIGNSLNMEFPSLYGIPTPEHIMSVEDVAGGARAGSRLLQALKSEQRVAILLKMAAALERSQEEILTANLMDVEASEKRNDPSCATLRRFMLSHKKIRTLAEGIRSIAAQPEPIGQLTSRTELVDGLILDKVTSPIGVLLVILGSRPDSLPQIAALAIKSGNGLVLKGDKQADRCNMLLHSIMVNAIEEGSHSKMPPSLIGLVRSDEQVMDLLKLDKLIDLVILKGSEQVVQHIRENTRIPVMGHTEGICHVYVDSAACEEKAISVVLDAKINDPSACNAAESLLLHTDTVASGLADHILRALRVAGVVLYGGEKAMALGLTGEKAPSMHREYGELSMTVEVMDSVQEAVDHIHMHGSGNTESIVTENEETAEIFLQSVDSACVFHNVSTRFADGYRFGLGAEVGIATGRNHARGPVGVEGLLTMKWLLRSSAPKGCTVGGLSPDVTTKKTFIFKKIPVL